LVLPDHDDPELIDDNTNLLEDSFVAADAARKDLPAMPREEIRTRRLRVLL
jgi:hypothetical protein